MGTPAPSNPFDNWRAMGISLYMVLVGYGVLVGIPVISSAWVNQLGFSEVEVGRVAGADLGGLSLGAVLTSLTIARFSRRHLTLLGIVISVAANGLCTITNAYEHVLWLRFASGIGSGIYTAVAVANLGATSRPARAFNFALFAFAFSQAGELAVLPLLSMNGIYLVFIVSYLLTLPFLGWFPAHRKRAAKDEGASGEGDRPPIPRYLPWMVLAAIGVTYINIGAYWTYIELASADSAADPDWVARALVLTSFFSVLGCLFATLISNRFGLARPLMITLVLQAIVVAMLANGVDNVNIVVSLFSFNFLWVFIDVYQMASVANVDPDGRYSALMPGAQGLGQIIGPNIAASVLAGGFGYHGVFILCASASILALLIYAIMYSRLRESSPALADAS
ncbi:MAG: MFS transporter [Pseudomonadota bacterium]